MSDILPYTPETLSRQEIAARPGPLLLEFGANGCGHCQAAQPAIIQALAAHPAFDHIKIEDGKGRPLGRSFRVTLWPTLIVLRDGVEQARLVRPLDANQIAAALAHASASASASA